MSEDERGALVDREKRNAARAALRWVRSGMVLGLGSGTTAGYFIAELGARVRNGRIKVQSVASSKGSEALATSAGIPLIPPQRGLRLDLTVDGADEIAPDLGLIKGRGGALLREKVLARAALSFLVIADSSKRVARLGSAPLPIEVIPFALPWVMDQIQAIGGQAALRMDPHSAERPFLSDQQNYILDCRFGPIEDPQAMAARLSDIPGIVEHGLFLGEADMALVGECQGVVLLRPGSALERIVDSDDAR